MTFAVRFRYELLCLLGAVLRKTGFKGISFLGTVVGYLIWYCVPSRRRLATESIMRHLQKNKKEAERIGLESFCHNGKSFLEILLTSKFGMDSPQLRIDSPELMEQLKQCQRPVVAATAHFGSWELLASMLGQLYQAPRPRVVVVRRYADEAVQTFIASCREATGADMVGHRQAAMSVLRALHKRGIVAFLVDHNTSQREAEFLPFLGEQAAVNMGPALLAVRSQALVWPVVLTREDNEYVFKLQPPLDTAELKGSREDQIRTVTEFYTKAIEDFIRQQPEQWFWMHNRWKTKDSGKQTV